VRPPSMIIDADAVRAAAINRVWNENPTGLRVMLQPLDCAWQAVHST
jgi:hypothetical protein